MIDSSYPTCLYVARDQGNPQWVLDYRVFGKTHPNGQRRVPISDVPSLYPELDIPLSCYRKVGILDVSSGSPVPAESIGITSLVTPGQVKVANGTYQVRTPRVLGGKAESHCQKKEPD